MEEYYADEIWKEYREDNYEEDYYILISNYGRVKKKNLKGDWYFSKTNKISKLTSVAVRRHSSSKYQYIHKAVARAFIENDNPEEKICVTHKDYDKDNNHVSNLVWMTRKEQGKHANASPNVKEKYFNSWNHTKKQIQLLKRKLLDPNRKTRVKILAKQFGYSEKQARRIMRGESWAEL